MKQSFDTKGYCNCGIVDNKHKRVIIKVHRYVGHSFIPNENNLPQINHLNGIKTDNYVENLEWTTNEENMLHSFKIGLRETSSQGIKNGRSILTEKDVIYIFTNPDNKTTVELIKQFNVEKTAIFSIYSGKN